MQHRQRAEITVMVLAGGRGRRMQGQDKGLIELSGQRMIDAILRALAPQCADIIISANRNLASYGRTGYLTVPDAYPGYCGPLAGIASVLAYTRTPLLLCVPCDSPFPADDLALRLWRALTRHGANLAVAHDGQRLQPVFCLIRTNMLAALQGYLMAGGRKLDTWYRQIGYTEVDFSNRPDMFFNVNYPEDRARAEARWA